MASAAQPKKVVIPAKLQVITAASRTEWFDKAAAPTTADYNLAEIRSFHTAVIRAYAGMQRTQRCAEVLLRSRHFGADVPLRRTVWCCKGADNTPPRVACEDRELTLRIVTPYLFGTDLIKHGGPWLSVSLVFSFLAGNTSLVAAEQNFVCLRPLGCLCPGKKANEAHQVLRDLELDKKKEKKAYVRYEPTDTDYAND